MPLMPLGQNLKIDLLLACTAYIQMRVASKALRRLARVIRHSAHSTLAYPRTRVATPTAHLTGPPPSPSKIKKAGLSASAPPPWLR